MTVSAWLSLRGKRSNLVATPRSAVAERRAREAKRDQGRTIEFAEYRNLKTGDNRADQED
jgi:hypothetical protein